MALRYILNHEKHLSLKVIYQWSLWQSIGISLVASRCLVPHCPFYYKRLRCGYVSQILVILGAMREAKKIRLYSYEHVVKGKVLNPSFLVISCSICGYLFMITLRYLDHGEHFSMRVTSMIISPLLEWSLWQSIGISLVASRCLVPWKAFYLWRRSWNTLVFSLPFLL